MSRIGIIVASGLLLAACSGGEKKPPAPPIKEEMTTTVKAASDLVFAIQSEVDPSMGGESAPDARWTEAAEAAERLKAVAVSLQDPARAKDQANWMKYVQEFAEISEALIVQAKAKNGVEFGNAANALLDNCSACHRQYQPQPPT